MRLRRNRNQDHEAGRPSDDVANQSSPEASLGEGVDLAASVVGEPEPERPVLFNTPVDDAAPEADSSDPLFDEVATYLRMTESSDRTRTMWSLRHSGSLRTTR